MKRVYFAGSIRGGREDLALYAALIARLRERSEVLTEFIGESTLEDIEAATMTDFDIYERDMALLHQADTVVAECSTPSLGVGYELGSAHALGLPVYILYRPRESRRLSAMVSGNRGFTLLPYGSREEALAAVNRILDALGVCAALPRLHRETANARDRPGPQARREAPYAGEARGKPSGGRFGLRPQPGTLHLP